MDIREQLELATALQKARDDAEQLQMTLGAIVHQEGGTYRITRATLLDMETKGFVLSVHNDRDGVMIGVVREDELEETE